jgi:DNA-directed RNA polymerase alpha subunit
MTEYDLVNKIHFHVYDTHERNCPGRGYKCDCRYDDTTRALLNEAAADIEHFRAKVDGLLDENRGLESEIDQLREELEEYKRIVRTAEPGDNKQADEWPGMQDEQLLDTPIVEVQFNNTRATNALLNGDFCIALNKYVRVETLRDLVGLTERDLRRGSNIGRVTIDIIKKKLAVLGLHLKQDYGA